MSAHCISLRFLWGQQVWERLGLVAAAEDMLGPPYESIFLMLSFSDRKIVFVSYCRQRPQVLETWSDLYPRSRPGVSLLLLWILGNKCSWALGLRPRLLSTLSHWDTALSANSGVF